MNTCFWDFLKNNNSIKSLEKKYFTKIRKCLNF